MTTFRRIATSLFVALPLAAASAAAQTATQVVSFEVQAINQLAFTGSPSLVISAAAAGGAPTAATAAASYAITTNESNRKITAQIDAAMPAGVTLSTELAAPTGATSVGPVVLGVAAQDVVTGIGAVSEAGLAVTYTLEATPAAGAVPADTRTVTYTVVAGA